MSNLSAIREAMKPHEPSVEFVEFNLEYAFEVILDDELPDSQIRFYLDQVFLNLWAMIAEQAKT